MSVISAGTTTTTAFKVTGDTTGTLQLQTGAVPTTAIDISATQVVTFPATTTLNFTGTLLLGDGSAAAPTLAHSGDTNTGIYFPGADQIAITTAGTQRVYVGATGDVGIGTGSPASFAGYKVVDINGTTGGLLALTSNGTNKFQMYVNGTSTTLVSISSEPLIFGTNSVERARITSTGGFALGTTVDPGVGNMMLAGTSKTIYANTTAGDRSYIEMYNSGTGDMTLGVTFSTAAIKFATGVSNTERARIDSSGNLGLGVTPSAWGSPFKALQSGASGYQSSIAFQTNDTVCNIFANAYYDGANYKYINSSQGASQYRVGDNQGAVGAGFKWLVAPSGTAGNTISFTTAMTLDASGRLGIGTASPAYKFQVLEATAAGAAISTSSATASTATLYLNVANNFSGVSQAFVQCSGPGNSGTSTLIFGTAGAAGDTTATERARITSDGDFLIGTTTASGKLAVFTSNIAGVGAYIRNAVADSNTTDGIQLFENSGQATGRHAISWYNGNQNYYKARIWTQVGNNYDNTRFSIEVANNARTVAERFAIYNGNCEISGNLTIAGSLSKGSGSFRIDHPLKPDTHQLVHSFIEGPQADLIYSGKVQLEDGVATVNIDVASGMTEGTFVVLCRDIRCFTNNETDWDNVRGKVVGNLLTIECQNPDSNAVISWMVIGERQDKHMYDTSWTDENGKVIVEPLKELH